MSQTEKQKKEKQRRKKEKKKLSLHETREHESTRKEEEGSYEVALKKGSSVSLMASESVSLWRL